MEEKTVYIVQFWLKPDGGQKVLDWLNGNHLTDVVNQPGFLWARMFDLEQADEDGWPAYMMMYGLESRQALEDYFNSEAPKQYARERIELGLDELLRAERYFGSPGEILRPGG
jgi:hypothetical protein